MYAVEPRVLARLEPLTRRVLIADPNPASARLLADLMRNFGAREVWFEPDERYALELADGANPTVIFVERSGPKLDGEAFTKRLRRSTFVCRRVPVIMVTSDATASTIKGARDSGVHEFLRKPFTTGDLLKRLEAVAVKPRDWIEAVQYVGPDRRRFNSAEFKGQRRRRADASTGARPEVDAKAEAKDRALRILKSAIAQYDVDPPQARRALADQAAYLKRAAVEIGSPALTVAVATLELALSQSHATPATLAGPVKRVLDLFEGPSSEKAA